MYPVRYARVMRALVVFAAVVFGCGGPRGGGGTAPPDPPADAGARAAAIDAAAHAAKPGRPDAAPRPLDEQACGRMADHMIDVQLDERRKAGKPLPDPGKIDEIRRGIRADFAAECAGKLPRTVYDCWMGADSQVQFEACAGGPSSPGD